ncbi:hypothetical protein L202_01866 [Cryptococcus amylolentus CBS 6039]|uniref:NADP-dependent oxidoreductase domain-containing protein n=1 Tax=Cryptococcus amylolentus CBS 6039 TaxID=1295533 RepID=A0A1E3I0A6_9TREE|nr:hypothetical protein L202_01866 [Cryptococcus amylolentus CBS 6039]ODN81436.1 hypothetical protein L202_01866 [Cryptococcus amylolentus CBS 6039]
MADYLSPYHPYQPEPNIAPFDLAKIPDEDIDKANTNQELLPKALKSPNSKNVVLSPLILGCAAFGYGMYTDQDHLTSSLPLRIVRLALRSGITSFDTSPWYNPSETILGNALRALDYPRGSYHLITKVGKYGPNCRDHIWDPEVIQASVERSLKRLGTDYLDAVYLHDVEYTLPPPSCSHTPLSDLPSVLAQPLVPTPEESTLLLAISTLRALQSSGKILKIGIAGYPLPVLLRLSLLVYHTTGTPLDIVQTFGHHTIQNSSIEKGYLQAFEQQAKVDRVISAAPLSMGLLTTDGGPEWHPARDIPPLWHAARAASSLCLASQTSLEQISLSYAYRAISQPSGKRVPVVIGCTELEHVKESVKMWNQVNHEDEEHSKGSRELEGKVRDLFGEEGVEDWSWTCPTDEQRAG